MAFEVFELSFRMVLNHLHKPFLRTTESLAYTNPPERIDKNYQTFCGT